MQNQSALAGLRIIDCSTVVMGPWATHFLAGYGAEIIKVEPPGGDIIRTAGTARNPAMSSIFLHAARGKRSVALDLKTSRGRDVLLRLLARADAFIHNIRPTAMQRLGISGAHLAEQLPELVILELAGYGSGGRYADFPAYDDLMQGASGLAAAFAANGDDPRYVPALIADRYVGVCAANALLAALVARARTGQGRRVEVAMFETMVELVCSDHLGGETFVPPAGPPGYARILVSNRRPYRTTDGFIGVLLYDERHWQRFFSIAGEADRFAIEPRLHDHATRAEHYDFAYGEVARVLASRTTAHWLATLREADLPVTPINDIPSLLTDGHLADVHFFGEQMHPTEGKIRTMDHGAVERTPAPRLGEDTRDVLGEAGYTSCEIDEMIAAGIAAQMVMTM